MSVNIPPHLFLWPTYIQYGREQESLWQTLVKPCFEIKTKEQKSCLETSLILQKRNSQPKCLHKILAFDQHIWKQALLSSKMFNQNSYNYKPKCLQKSITWKPKCLRKSLSSKCLNKILALNRNIWKGALLLIQNAWIKSNFKTKMPKEKTFFENKMFEQRLSTKLTRANFLLRS